MLLRTATLGILLAAVCGVGASAAERDETAAAAGIDFFEKRIRR